MSVLIEGAEAILQDRKAEVIDYSNKNIHNYPVIIRCTLSPEERAEASDIVTATLENTTWGVTKIATNIKISYDKSFGAPWQVIVGESFSCSLDQELLIYMYNGSLSILAWKELKYITDEKEDKKKRIIHKKKLP